MVLIPPLAYFSWRRVGVPLSARQLAASDAFAASFGFLEAVVVVYLRATAGLLPGYKGTQRSSLNLGEVYGRKVVRGEKRGLACHRCGAQKFHPAPI
jgi:hypothetical protein